MVVLDCIVLYCIIFANQEGEKKDSLLCERVALWLEIEQFFAFD